MPQRARPGDARACDVNRYRSFSALLAGAQETPLCGKDEYNARHWQRIVDCAHDNRAWALGDDVPDDVRGLADVARWLLHGWPRGVERMRAGIGSVSMPKLADVRRRGRWSDVGDVLSLDRLYAGDTERCWRTTHRARIGAPPRLQIIVNASRSAHVDEETGTWRGVAGIALAEAAIAAGYAVAVDSIGGFMGYTETRNVDAIQMTRVKDYDAPCNVDTLCALVAHPAAFRVVAFAHAYNHAVDQCNGYLGSPMDLSYTRLQELDDALDHRSIHVVVPMNTISAEAAKHWVQTQVDMLGAEGSEEA